MASAFPPPPPYFKLYENYEDEPESAPAPPPPLSGSYTVYGTEHSTEDLLPDLEEQGVRQLYSKDKNISVKAELKALSREVMVQFLELTDMLVQRPSQHNKRVEDLGLLFKNIHHLLNSLRPHQARATLIHILEVQLEQRKFAISDLKKRREEAKELLRTAAEDFQAQIREINENEHL